MKFDDFTIRIILIGIPGIVAYFLTNNWIIRSRDDNFIKIFLVLLYSIASYMLLAAVYRFIPEMEDRVFESVFYGRQPIDWRDIAGATVCSVVVAIVHSYVHKFNFMIELGKRINCTQRFAEYDVWQEVHDMISAEQSPWVFVRDTEKSLTYYGCVEKYSDSSTHRELLLGDVSVFSSDTPTEPLYSVEYIYLSRDRAD